MKRLRLRAWRSAESPPWPCHLTARVRRSPGRRRRARLRRRSGCSARSAAVPAGPRGERPGARPAGAFCRRRSISARVRRAPRPPGADAARARRNGLVQRREHVGRRPEAERRIRHAQHVGALRDFDLHGRRHARLELQLLIGHVDDRGVGRDVLDDDRLQPDLRHGAFEHFRRIRVDVERDVLAGTDAADVRFVDVRVDLHLGQIRGDDEERRRRHARGDGLAHVDAALNHDAVDRRRDHGVVKVDLILIDRCLRLLDGRLRRLQRRLRRVHGDLGGVEVALRDEALGREFLRPRVFLLRVGERDLVALGVRLRLDEIGLRLLQLRFEERRVELRDYLVLLHDRIEVGAEP